MTDLILSDSRNNVEVKTGREINNSILWKFTNSWERMFSLNITKFEEIHTQTYQWNKNKNKWTNRIPFYIILFPRTGQDRTVRTVRDGTVRTVRDGMRQILPMNSDWVRSSIDYYDRTDNKKQILKIKLLN